VCRPLRSLMYNRSFTTLCYASRVAGLGYLSAVTSQRHKSQLRTKLFRPNDTGPITLVNSPVLTTHGQFRMSAIELNTAKCLVKSRGFTSAVGHESTAALVSQLLGIECAPNRITASQAVGDLWLVFRTRQRLPEGVVLDATALNTIPCEWCLLERLQ